MRTLEKGLVLALLAAPTTALAWSSSGSLGARPITAAPDELEDEFGEVEEAWYERVVAAEGAEQGRIYTQERPHAQFVPKFRSIAERAQGKEIAIDAWLWIFQNANDGKSNLDALKQLLDGYLESPRMADVAAAMNYTWNSLGREPIEAGFEKLALESPHDQVKAAGWFGVAQLYNGYGEVDAALEAINVIRDEFEVHEGAERLAYELENLQIGMLAPDFEAVDQVGVKFKLSDYRGKVVLLDFWGFW